MERDQADAMRELYSAIVSLQNEEECAAFLEDICTIRELQDISQRLSVAILLEEGKNYQDICRMTGASTATISRVNKCLHYGSRGYQTVLSRRKEKQP